MTAHDFRAAPNKRRRTKKDAAQLAWIYQRLTEAMNLERQLRRRKRRYPQATEAAHALANIIGDDLVGAAFKEDELK
jgi:hypothetical protein